MRLLFITATRIGDAVLSTGLLDATIRAHPGLRVTVACGPVAAGLFEAVPGLEKLIVLRKGPRAAHWRALWREVVGRRWDLVIDLRASAVSWLIRADRRHWLRSANTGDHKVVQLARLLSLSPPPAPRLWLGPANRAAGLRLVPAGPPVLALAPIANWYAKTWPAERFIELAERLTAAKAPLAGARVAVVAGPDERTAAQPVLDALPPARRLDLIGAGPLLDTQAALERCALFIGNDSGLMHMAAAAGIPTLGLFGPSDDRLYAPWGPRTAVVRTPESFLTLNPPGGDWRSMPPAMVSLRVDAVEEAARQLWRRLGETTADQTPDQAPNQG
ncbi:glycosyl transferase family protein [Rhodospirillum rubrum F11]|uniref:Glycosyl transferase, family 9 n=2 Tax=Rhodospirillum rubrum TaxID=1085 RepID=Q2RS65_RHORT|nr:glycosyltransferase family 9 protein [Rhodospirillum rubrum]ABC23030.1 Glycosyl transferase, family 9 [Rhodospirillum rubrum ATCC 11170]AEO48759.1 glycosyl transferase family protein [Rhodospirillum rubrum F11]MBK5954657.1 glycosyl transferase [Rhodospirillum rubrum]QXG79014.1 glycosyltransferase family 9 protein [Rhodospirillum rubrum]